MPELPKVLVVDDEDRIRKLVRMYLERNSFFVEEAVNGEEALEKALNVDFSVIILDLMLPGMDGWTVCKELRKQKGTPIIMLTATGEEANRIQGFELGADDYVVKPFSPRELVMRTKAMLKRSKAGPTVYEPTNISKILTFPNLTINMESRKVLIGGKEVSLAPKEFHLLYYLASRPEKVFSRDELLRDVWNYQFYVGGDQRTVDTHVKRLREKLTNVSEDVAAMIVTVWGVGYKFKLPA